MRYGSRVAHDVDNRKAIMSAGQTPGGGISDAALRFKTKVAGACWLVTILAGACAAFLRPPLFIDRLAHPPIHVLAAGHRCADGLRRFGLALTFLSPSLAKQLTPFNLLPGILGEASLTFWVLAKGVDVAKWREKARGR
jgi:hypothetical protein